MTILRDVAVEGLGRVDVALRDGRIAAIAPRLSGHAAIEIDGRGGALIPGLWDHHHPPVRDRRARRLAQRDGARPRRAGGDAARGGTAAPTGAMAARRRP
ncbi:MAG: hypothetical protein PGN08_06055 [Sphingomonas taxi]